MHAFADIQDVQWERETRRSRLRSLIRGWLRKERAPRLTILLLLIPCAALAVLADYWMRRAGIDVRAVRWASAVLPSWPLFKIPLPPSRTR